MSDFIFPTRSAGDYASLIAQYCPNDILFEAKNIPGSNLRKLFIGIGQGLADYNNDVKEFVDDMSPEVTEKFIEEWEDVVGIPDDCFEITEEVDDIQSLLNTDVVSNLSNFIVTIQQPDNPVVTGEPITLAGLPNVREITSIVISSGKALVTTNSNHGFSVGDSVDIIDITSPSGLTGAQTITDQDTDDTFKFSTASTGTVTLGTRPEVIKPDSASWLNGNYTVLNGFVSTFQVSVQFDDRFSVPSSFNEITLTKQDVQPLDNASRRLQIIAKLSMMSVQTVDDFIALADFLGFSIKIYPGNDDFNVISVLGNSNQIASATTATDHPYFVGQNVTIAGADDSTVQLTLDDLTNVTNVNVAVAEGSTEHGYVDGTLISIFSAPTGFFNVTNKPVTVINDTDFSYVITGTTTVTAQTGALSQHTFSPSYYNGGVIITDVADSTHFQYSVAPGNNNLATTSTEITAVAATEDLTETERRYTIVVYTNIDVGNSFPYVFPIFFGGDQSVQIECIFNKIAPANCQVIYLHNVEF